MLKKLALTALVLIGLASGSIAVANADQPAAPCAACVGVIGDSATYQAGAGVAALTSRIVARGYKAADVRVDALAARSIAGAAAPPSSLDVIRAWRAAGFDPAVFVIALGTNNKNAAPKAWTREVNKVLAEIGPGHTVHWIGLGFRDGADARVASFTATIGALPGLTFHDWNAYIRVKPQAGLWLASDPNGVHMTKPGYVIRNDYVAAVLPAVPAK